MEYKDKKSDDILEKLVHINRITKVVKCGRRFGLVGSVRKHGERKVWESGSVSRIRWR